MEERLSLGWSGDDCTRASPFPAVSLARSLLFFNYYRPPGWDSSVITSPRAVFRKKTLKELIFDFNFECSWNLLIKLSDSIFFVKGFLTTKQIMFVEPFKFSGSLVSLVTYIFLGKCTFHLYFLYWHKT